MSNQPHADKKTTQYYQQKFDDFKSSTFLTVNRTKHTLGISRQHFLIDRFPNPVKLLPNPRHPTTTHTAYATVCSVAWHP